MDAPEIDAVNQRLGDGPLSTRLYLRSGQPVARWHSSANRALPVVAFVLTIVAFVLLRIRVPLGLTLIVGIVALIAGVAALTLRSIPTTVIRYEGDIRRCHVDDVKRSLLDPLPKQLALHVVLKALADARDLAIQHPAPPPPPDPNPVSDLRRFLAQDAGEDTEDGRLSIVDGDSKDGAVSLASPSSPSDDGITRP